MDISSSPCEAKRCRSLSDSGARHATVYEAVAGRVGTDGFLKKSVPPARFRDITSKPQKPIKPDEVLFKQRRAPERYEEDDIYWAHEKLQLHQQLPDSDILKAVHAYVAALYANGPDCGEKSPSTKLDETSLLAVGILMEETLRSVVGETGDKVFTEGEGEDLRTKIWSGTDWIPSVIDRTGEITRRAEHNRIQRILDQT